MHAPRIITRGRGPLSLLITLALFTGSCGPTPRSQTTDNRSAQEPQLPAAFASAVAPESVNTIDGKVVGIADGDTITVLKDQTQFKIRLEGIDAPEGGQAYGTQARKALGDIVFQKDVEVRWEGEDKYNRILGDVYLGGRWINKELVEEGWAWHYKQYSTSPILAQAEAEARAQKRGLWQDAHPIAPWDFRHSPSTALIPTPSTALVPTDKQEQTVYITKTGSKYHTAGCRYLAKSSIPIPLSEAKKRYTPCSVCGAGFLGSREGQSSPSPSISSSAREPQTSTEQEGGYWITTSSGIRHNSGCRYYRNSKGRPCGPNEGRACRICGG